LRRYATHGGAIWALRLLFTQAAAPTRRVPRASLRRPKATFTCQSAVPSARAPASQPEPGAANVLLHPPAASAPPGNFPPLAPGLTDGLGGVLGGKAKALSAQPVASASFDQPPSPLPPSPPA